VISLHHISKRFGQVQALDDVTVELNAGEVLAIVGENGAGKSTLMNVLYGLYPTDTGEVRVDSKAVTLGSPRAAIALGIGMVHQHFMLSPSLTVAENVVLGHEPTRFGLLDLERANREVAASAARHGFNLDVRAPISSLGVGAQQKVEILKALHRGARLLILDEPTAVLTPQESDELWSAVRSLKEQGTTVVLISHKLREVLAIADRLVVLRRGRKVLETPAAGTTREALAHAMVGEGRALNVSLDDRAPRAEGATPRLQLEGLHTEPAPGHPALSNVALTLEAGEIVGVAGVDGNGQRELVEALVGLRPFTRGKLRLNGADVSAADIADRRAAGLSYIPEDRLREAIVGAMSVEENIALGRQQRPPFARGRWISFPERRREAEALAQDYDVRPPDPALPIAALSGGNQQKVVVGRELGGKPTVIVAVQPTRGLDIAALTAVHQRLVSARNSGAGVLLVSLDLEELLSVSDRIVVLFQGSLVGEQRRGAYDERTLGQWMLGAKAA
jgi:general nucleoside transport system ATP-binding protein